MNRSVPVHPVVPPVAAGLAVVTAALQTVSLAVCLAEGENQAGRLLAGDGPGSLARLFVAGVLAASAVVALAGARRSPARRCWWSAVALVRVPSRSRSSPGWPTPG